LGSIADALRRIEAPKRRMLSPCSVGERDILQGLLGRFEHHSHAAANEGRDC
jgi:hypothetical protein